jgi:hypothetical protein
VHEAGEPAHKPQHLRRVKDQPRPRQGSSEATQLGTTGQGQALGQMESVTRPGTPARPRSGQTPVKPGSQARASCRMASRPGLQSGPQCSDRGSHDPRRDLRITTVRQGEQGRRGGHLPGLRPPGHVDPQIQAIRFEPDSREMPEPVSGNSPN